MGEEYIKAFTDQVGDTGIDPIGNPAFMGWIASAFLDEQTKLFKDNHEKSMELYKKQQKTLIELIKAQQEFYEVFSK